MTSASSLALANPSPVTDPSTESSQKRQRSLDATQSLFLRYGVKRTPVEDIAQEAGVAKGTVYLYFKSKAEIFLSLIERHCADTWSAAKALAAGNAPFTERLVGLLDCYIGKTRRLVAT